MFRSKVAKFALTSTFLAAAIGGVIGVRAWDSTSAPATAAATVRVAELPPQGRETYELIRRGGPFPYQKDGSVFGNRERLLPGAKRGYYLEYTVKTPGSRDRGARRIVCGGPPRLPDTCYYTADHYASFRKIVNE